MSIKYLQDQQLNQVQQSPNNSPWAKLIAQSEMLERNKMRQPQGQAPQGTVAGNIQQQLAAAQQQESEKQNVDLQKAQLLAQLIGSGHLPASFAAQGYADGGLTQPQAGTGVYRGIMMPNQPPQMQGQFRGYTPPNSQDPAAQEKKHGMLQSMLDNSIVGMAQGKANIGNAMQDYADLFSGKMFSRGFAEGGDIRGFAGGGGLEKFLNRYPKHPSTVAINPYLQAPPGVQYQDVPELKKALEGAKINNELAELLRQDPSALDKVKTYFGKQPKGLPYIPQISESPELQEYYKSLYEPKTRGDVYNSLAQQANAPTPSASGVEQMKIPPRGSMPPQEQPTVGPRVDPTAEFKSRIYGEQSGISPARSNLMGTLLNVAEQKEALANQPKPSMTERLREAGMAGYNDKTILDTMANKMSATDRINATNKPAIPVDPMAPDAATLEDMAAKAKQGLGSLGEATKAVGRPIAKVAGALSPIGDLMMAGQVTGNNTPLLAKALGIEVPSMLSQGEVSPVLGRLANDITDAKNYVGDKAASAYDQFKNKLNANSTQPDAWTGGATTPQTPPTQIETQTPTQTPQQGAIYKDNGVTRPKNSVTVTPDKRIDLDAMSNAHKQPDVQPSQVSEAAQKVAAAQQAISAIERKPNEEGQGSILDSLYSKLKDTDVDYSDLAKRISQNEYDLARERKDGTLNAILGGVGAALTQAGTYQGVGDRVFKPGLGAIAGAGIMGGLKMSAASDEAIDKKAQDNMTAMIALKKLKRESMNDVLDAISAQRQVAAIERGQDITAGTHAATNKLTAAEIGVKARMADIAELTAKADAMFKAAQEKKLNIEITDANDKLLVDSLNKQLGDYANLLSGADKNSLGLTPEQRQGYQARLDGTQSQLDAIYAKYGSNVPKIKPLSGGQYQGFKNLTDQ